jgi:transglutaminase-like putative cysteine protease
MKKASLLLPIIAISATFCYRATAADSAGQHWWDYVRVLADDNMEGRNTGSAGHRRAASYIARQFESSGLQPAGTEGFFQPVPFEVITVDQDRSNAALVHGDKVEPLTYGEEVLVSSRDNFAAPIEAPLVFIGYGLSAAAAGYDDFAGLDLHGKIAVYLTGAGPSSVPGNMRAHFGSNTLRRKALADAGAIGLVRLIDPSFMDIPWTRIRGNAKSPNMVLADPDLQDERGHTISVTVNPEKTERWFTGSGHSFAELLKLAKDGQPLPHFPLAFSLRAQSIVQQSKVDSQNVVAVLPGNDLQLKNEYVVLSAHLDHLGVGTPINGDSIFNGAMDNASGVASLLEIAKQMKDAGLHTRRSLLFLAVTGEEKGLLGSRYFTAHPTVPLQSIVADLNLDMFLPIHPMHVMTIFGLGESSIGNTVREIAAKHGFKTQDDPYPQRNIFIRSDQYNFILHGIPSVMCMDGSEKGSKDEEVERAWLETRYHAPSDDLNQPVDLDAAAQFNSVMKDVIIEIADAQARPTWNRNSFFRRFQQGADRVSTAATVREFTFTYQATVHSAPAGSNRLDVWLPVPHDDEFQQIENLSVDSPAKYEFTAAANGNRYLHIDTAASDKDLPVAIRFVARRSERGQSDLSPHADATAPTNLDAYLKPDRLVPLDDQIRTWAQQVVTQAHAQTDLEKARAIFNHVVATVKYDKSGKGWGRGDVYYACDARRGNCTDFHAIFIGYARAVGIPARFSIGFPIPAERGAGKVAGYHCWAEFYAKGIGWIPVDASEAAKDPSRREYFFGHLDENRVQFSTGRDLVLAPPQAGEPLNYFVYPYAELDGKPFDGIESSFRFEDIQSPLDLDQHTSALR